MSFVPEIPGEATQKFYEKWIVVESLSQSFDSADKASKSACSVSVTKAFDKAEPLLWAAAVTGQVFSEVRIDVLKSGEEQLKFYDLVLSNVRISNIEASPGKFTESLLLVGTSAKLTYYLHAGRTVVETVSSTVPCK